MQHRLAVVLGFGFLLWGCDQITGGAEGAGAASKPEAPAKAAPAAAPDPAPKPAAAAKPAEPSAAAQPTGALTGATAQGYDLSAIKPVADNCQSAKVLLASAPISVGPEYQWPWARQAMLANQQFKVVQSAVTTPGTVTFKVFDYSGSFALVAFCGDGSTCNQLAAMHKATVRSSNPQVFCGDIPGIQKDSPVFSPMLVNPASPKDSLPDEKDTVGLCARLSACMIATDRATPGNPGLDCQKAPSKFKTACARKYPCAEVMACLGQ